MFFVRRGRGIGVERANGRCRLRWSSGRILRQTRPPGWLELVKQMGEYWATRTGRWRRAMQSTQAPSLAERLYQVIRKDVEAGQLPAGAILPTAERVGGELTIDPPDVENAYARLLADGFLEERADGALCIASQGRETSVGDATQIRFEGALLKAVREAAARGLTSSEATGMFKAAALRMEEMERKRRGE